MSKSLRLLLALALVAAGAVVPTEALTSPAGASSPPQYMLDNGRIRFGGSGGTNASTADVNTASITQSGMPAQPYYRAADGRWFKLTFSDAPLSMTVGTGNPATPNNWTGSNVPINTTYFDNGRLGLTRLDDLVVTATNWFERRSGSNISVGYGVLSAEGTVLVNGQQLGIRHVIELGKDDSFVRITTRLKNDDTEDASNVHLWVGTRDDWVGTSDRPTKTRGNLTATGFEAITNQQDTSDALQITSGSEGVLFYSTTTGVNTSHAGCCNFSNTYNLNPVSAPIATTGDGSYALYLPVGDLAPGASREIVWFYAAGATADLAAVAQAVAQAAAGLSAVDERTSSSAELTYTPAVDGQVHAIVVPAGSPEPTPAQIRAGVPYGDPLVTPVFSTPSAGLLGEEGEDVEIEITGLLPTTAYDVYLVTVYEEAEAAETAGDPDVMVERFSDVSVVSFTTRAGAPTAVSVPLIVGSDVIIEFEPGDGEIDGYEYRLNGLDPWIPIVGTTSPLTISGLTGGDVYLFELRAVRNGDPGEISLSLSFIFPEVSVLERTDTTAEVRLSTPQAGTVHSMLLPAGADTPTAAQIRDGVGPGDPAVAPLLTDSQEQGAGAALTLDIEDLDPTTSYVLHVVVEYLAEDPEDESEQVAVLTQPVSRAFTTRPGAPEIIDVSAGTRRIDVEIGAATGTVTAYEARWSSDEGATFSAWTSMGATTTFTIGSLLPGACYELELRAVSSGDPGAVVAVDGKTCVPIELPGAPTGLTLTPLDEALRVSFDAPTQTGDVQFGLSGYEFRVDEGEWLPLASGLITEFEIVDLTNGVARTVRVRAINALGPGLPSSPVTEAPGIPDASEVELMLDNGLLRFGGGGHNSAGFYSTVRSVAESGMLRQPFYLADNGRWYKLTFSDAPLSMAIGTGNPATPSNWTGSTLATGGNFDSGRMGLIRLSGFTDNSTDEAWTPVRAPVDGVSAGFGTVVVSGTVTANGRELAIQQTFRLGEEDRFLEVTTKVTNPSGSPVENVNLWVGTRDDWVENTDRPMKTRGTLEDGVFTPIADPAEPAPVLRISNAGHGIFFYSTTPGANGVWSNCCNFANVTNTDPAVNPVTSGASHDGSYGLHLPVGDLAANASAELVWYYAAGSTVDLDAAARQIADRATPTSALITTGPIVLPGGSPRATLTTPVGVVGSSLVQVSAVPSGTIRQGGTQVVSTGASISASSVTVNLDVSAAGEVRTPAGSSPQVSVVRDSVAQTSGTGMAPNTLLQTWLPLPGGQFRPVTTIPVGPDGSFSGDLPFDGRADRTTDGRPLPIGTHTLQLVGINVDQDITVIEQVVRIQQPAPTPEPDRRAGAVPALRPGSTLATNAGIPERVLIVPIPDVRQARIEGSGWTMAIDVPSPEGRILPSEAGGALIELVADEVAEVSGEGFLPGTRADVWMFSEPRLLGTVTIGPDGRFAGQVDLAGVTIGEHTLQLQGVGTDGYVRAANLGVVVVPQRVDVTPEPEAPEPAITDEALASPELLPEAEASEVSPGSRGRISILGVMTLVLALLGLVWWMLAARRDNDEDESPDGSDVARAAVVDSGQRSAG